MVGGELGDLVVGTLVAGELGVLLGAFVGGDSSNDSEGEEGALVEGVLVRYFGAIASLLPETLFTALLM